MNIYSVVETSPVLLQQLPIFGHGLGSAPADHNNTLKCPLVFDNIHSLNFLANTANFAVLRAEHFSMASCYLLMNQRVSDHY